MTARKDIRAYMRQHSTGTGAAIKRVHPHYSDSCIYATLMRMADDGELIRVSRGVYMLSEALNITDELIVAGTLDRLFSMYPAAIRDELKRRGWRK